MGVAQMVECLPSMPKALRLISRAAEGTHSTNILALGLWNQKLVFNQGHPHSEFDVSLGYIRSSLKINENNKMLVSKQKLRYSPSNI